MSGTATGFTVNGTVMHAPAPGEIEVLPDALVLVDGDGTIDAVLTADHPGHARARTSARNNGTLRQLKEGQYLLPGLVDLHIHAPQFPQIGKALHLPLADWLQQYTFPLEARYGDMAFAERIYASLVDTLLANGTTTALYFATVHIGSSKRLAELCLEKGQRGLVGKVAMDNLDECPDFYRDASTEAGLAETRALIDHVWSLPGNGHGLVRPVVTPRFIPSCTDAMLEGLGAIAAEHDCHVQTHCSESDWEHGYVIARHGKRDTESLEDFGLLGRRSVLAHANFIDDGDMNIIEGRGSGIAHCPLSNYYFSNAVFPLRRALEKRLHVGLGTDISGGPHPSLLESCRHVINASRVLEDGVDAASPAGGRGIAGSHVDFMEAFWLATTGGGQALDLPVGVIAKGFLFDAILVDATVTDSNLMVFDDLDTAEDVFQKIVYTASRNNVRKVWVHGKLVVDKDGEADWTTASQASMNQGKST